MSSKLTHLVWNYRTDKVEDKLMLLALAELSDRKGAFETSVAELAELTSMSSGMVKTVLSHFANSRIKLVKLPPREPQRDNELFSGLLTIDGPQARTLPVVEMDLMEMAREQNERLNQNKKNNHGKLNRSQRSQITPLNRSREEKQYNVLEIYMEKIPDWAEGLMFKKGVHGRQDIWDAFVVDVHGTGENIFSQTQLINRLHQKIDYFKGQSFSNLEQNAPFRPAKQSALSAFEEKYQDYLYDEHDD